MQIIKSAPHVAPGHRNTALSVVASAQAFCCLTVVAFVRFALLYQCKFTSSFEIRIRNLLNVSEISERQSAPRRGCKGRHIALLHVFAQIKTLQLENKKNRNASKKCRKCCCCCCCVSYLTFCLRIQYENIQRHQMKDKKHADERATAVWQQQQNAIKTKTKAAIELHLYVCAPF